MSTQADASVNITAVEYRELATFGNYQNVTIGAVASVGIGENPKDVLGNLQGFVRDQIEVHVAGAIKQEQAERDAQSERWQKEAELNSLTSKIAAGQRVLSQLKDILEKHGVKWCDPEIPF